MSGGRLARGEAVKLPMNGRSGLRFVLDCSNEKAFMGDGCKEDHSEAEGQDVAVLHAVIATDLTNTAFTPDNVN